MESKIISFCLIFSMLFFTSFASENKSETLPKQEISETKIISQKENLAQFKKPKFKERVVLKSIEKKIKKKQSKVIKNSLKIEPALLTSIELFLAVLILTSLILSIFSLFSGNILIGILLLLIAALLALIFIGFAMIDNEGQRV